MLCHASRKKKKALSVKVGNIALPIYKGMIRGRVRYTISYREAGERKRETFATEDAARARAEEIAVKIENGQRDVLTLTGTDKESYALAVRELEATGVPLLTAVREYIAASKILQGGSLLAAAKDYARRKTGITPRLVPELVEEFLEKQKKDGARIRYLQSLRSHLRRFAKHFHTNISSVTTTVIDDWLRETKGTPRTRNNMRGSVITLFSYARDHGFLPKGFPTEADAVPKAKDRGGDIGFLTPAQLSKLLFPSEEEIAAKTEVPEEARLYFALGAFTGIRSAELVRLTWDAVNVARGYIEVGKNRAKTATRRLVPIHSNLTPWLQPFAGRQGKLFTGEKASARAIAYAKQKGIKWPQNCLRHSYATYRLAVTQDAAKVALEMGNSPSMLFQHYRELATPEDAATWFGIKPDAPVNVIPMKGAA